jgi:hypothetical protein
MKIALIIIVFLGLNSAWAANFNETLTVDGAELNLDTSRNFGSSLAIKKEGKDHGHILSGWYLRLGTTGAAEAMEIFKHFNTAKIKSSSSDQIAFEWAEPGGWVLEYSVKLEKNSKGIVVLEKINVLQAPIQNYRVTYSARAEQFYFPLASLKEKSPRVELIYRKDDQSFLFEIQSVTLDKTLDKPVGTPISSDLPKSVVQGKGAQFWAITQDLDLFLWLSQRIALEGDLVPNSTPWVSSGFFSAFNYGFQWNQSSPGAVTVVTEFRD